MCLSGVKYRGEEVKILLSLIFVVPLGEYSDFFCININQFLLFF